MGLFLHFFVELMLYTYEVADSESERCSCKSGTRLRKAWFLRSTYCALPHKTNYNHNFIVML